MIPLTRKNTKAPTNTVRSPYYQTRKRAKTVRHQTILDGKLDPIKKNVTIRLAGWFNDGRVRGFQGKTEVVKIHPDGLWQVAK